MINEETAQELPVTFNPALFLQRRGWVFETMTLEGVTNVRVIVFISISQHQSDSLKGRRHRVR